MDNDLFIIDLTSCANTGEIITSVSGAFELPNARERQIGLKFGDIALNQAQMLSIQSLIASWGSELKYLESANEITKELALSMGIEAKFVPLTQEIPPQDNVSFEIKPNEGFESFNQEINIEAKDFSANGLNIEPSINFDTNGNNSSQVQNTWEKSADEIQEEISQDINEKQVMETYKKAYDENEEEEQTWEEVDYYAPPTDEPVVVDSKQTIYVNQTLRSGQVLEFDGNIVIIGDCHPGSEIKAAGDITVWGVLGSIAHAGSKGNREAKIRALKMNAVQLRIADCYSRRPDGTNIPYIIKSSTFTPEEARIVDNSIVLFKIN